MTDQQNAQERGGKTTDGDHSATTEKNHRSERQAQRRQKQTGT